MTKRFGFTLAEVLITLGIIGVVAAMTIPTLVADYQVKSWGTASSVFEKKLEVALKTMNTQQTLAGYTTTKDFVNELSKHFKITRICDTNELSNCFAGKISWNTVDIQAKTEVLDEVDLSAVTSARDLGQKDWGTEVIGVQFANGVTGVVAYNPECKQDPYSNQIVGTSCLAMAYDTSGFKSPNEFGKDLRGINAKLAKCAFKSGSTCFGQPFMAQSITNAECFALKDELGIECSTRDPLGDKDNWGGTVKACGGIENMPTAEHLAQLANYLYNKDSIGPTDSYSGNFNLEKYLALGFTQPLENDWVTGHIWGNEIDTTVSNNAIVYGRFFHMYSGRISTQYSSGFRSNSSQAVCIVNN